MHRPRPLHAHGLALVPVLEARTEDQQHAHDTNDGSLGMVVCRAVSQPGYVCQCFASTSKWLHTSSATDVTRAAGQVACCFDGKVSGLEGLCTNVITALGASQPDCTDCCYSDTNYIAWRIYIRATQEMYEHTNTPKVD